MATAADELSILKAQMKDVEDVVDLTINVFFGALGDDMGFNNCRATAFAQLTDEQEQSIRSAILLSYKIERGSAFKATTSDGRLVGFVTADRGRKGDQTALLLTNLAVSPSERRRNLGRRLVQRVLAAAGERPVVLEVESNNADRVQRLGLTGFAGAPVYCPRCISEGHFNFRSPCTPSLSS